MTRPWRTTKTRAGYWQLLFIWIRSDHSRKARGGVSPCNAADASVQLRTGASAPTSPSEVEGLERRVADQAHHQCLPRRRAPVERRPSRRHAKVKGRRRRDDKVKGALEAVEEVGRQWLRFVGRDGRRRRIRRGRLIERGRGDGPRRRGAARRCRERDVGNDGRLRGLSAMMHELAGLAACTLRTRSTSAVLEVGDFNVGRPCSPKGSLGRERLAGGASPAGAARRRG
jgi:hypothetical protein